MNKITLNEVSKHITENDLWIVIDDHVFDISEYIFLHPGGKSILLKYAGRDCTNEFNNINGHFDTYVNSLLNRYCIGIINS
jgi:cytochrome b involved in lipid metabolism